MTPDTLRPARRPTFYFVGVTTGASSIMRVFPEWARYLRLGDCVIEGIDCRSHDSPEAYRSVVSFLKADPLSVGALVTTHKIDLLEAARDLFDEQDPYASLMGEVSCISKRAGRLCGHATDPITVSLALEAFLPNGYWRETGAEALVLNAGGPSIAIASYLMKPEHGDNRPARIVVTNRSSARLDEMRRIHARLAAGVPCDYHHCPRLEDYDQLVAGLKPGSLVVNATGLGKNAPGSPLTTAATFPERGIAWDFNYRGNLVFLDQARAQQERRGLRIEDGWVYFIHGWTHVIAEVFDVAIASTGPQFDELSRIAAACR